MYPKKMKLLIKSLLLSAIMVLSFFAGTVYEKYSLLEGRRFKLTESLTMQTGQNETGILPKDVVLYEYDSGHSVGTYVVFINTKRNDVLELISFEERFTLVPVEVY